MTGGITALITRVATLIGAIGVMALNAEAGTILYSVQLYGSRHAVVNFSGSGSEELSVTPSSNGDFVRISGVNVQFAPQEPVSLKGIITSVRQVQRGALTDLVLALGAPISVSATPAQGNLKLILKGKPLIRKSVEPNGTPTPPLEAPSSPTRAIPITVTSTLPTKDSPQSGITFVFPDSGRILPKTSLAKVLLSSSAITEILWSIATGQPLQFTSESGRDTSSLSEAETDQRDEELDRLLGELTQELVELRTQIIKKDKEISELRALKSTND